MSKIVLFDSDCVFCHKSVHFILKRDSKKQLLFASLQSDVGRILLKKYRIDADIDSIVFIEENRAYLKSTAVLHVCKYLRGIWSLFFIGIIIPIKIRDFSYDIVATVRYSLFKKQSKCKVLTREDQERFLT